MRRASPLQLILLACVIAAAGSPGCHRPPRSAGEPPASAAQRGFQALYQARVEGPGSSRSLRLAVAVGHDDAFRVEVLGPIGGARLALVFAGTRLHAVFPAQRLCGEWQDTAAALGALTGIALPAPQWLAFLLGRATGADLGRHAFEIDEVTDGWVIRARLADTGPGGAGPALTVTYSDFRPAPGGELAAAVRIRRGEQGVTLNLRQLHSLPSPAESLQLPCPAGFGAATAEEFSTAGVSLLGEER